METETQEIKFNQSISEWFFSEGPLAFLIRCFGILHFLIPIPSIVFILGKHPDLILGYAAFFALMAFQGTLLVRFQWAGRYLAIFIGLYSLLVLCFTANFVKLPDLTDLGTNHFMSRTAVGLGWYGILSLLLLANPVAGRLFLNPQKKALDKINEIKNCGIDAVSVPKYKAQVLELIVSSIGALYLALSILALAWLYFLYGCSYEASMNFLASCFQHKGGTVRKLELYRDSRKLKLGMTTSEVMSLIGKPDQIWPDRLGEEMEEVWGYPCYRRGIKCHFLQSDKRLHKIDIEWDNQTTGKYDKLEDESWRLRYKYDSTVNAIWERNLPDDPLVRLRLCRYLTDRTCGLLSASPKTEEVMYAVRTAISESMNPSATIEALTDKVVSELLRELPGAKEIDFRNLPRAGN
ncbi:MAG: hypothetical protein PHW04_03750 [Candidatus Wallbacteria bacterium]|nr:hypothetical protein [Candidatus Wallbacteria bacterium]